MPTEVYPLTNRAAQDFVLGQLALLSPSVYYYTSIQSCLDLFHSHGHLHCLHKACQYAWGSHPPAGIRVVPESIAPFQYECYLTIHEPLGKAKHLSEAKVSITFSVNYKDYKGIRNKEDLLDLVNAMINGEADWPETRKVTILSS